jgi:anaerobic ribonucleoside-triphosphate reductase activating protein
MSVVVPKAKPFPDPVNTLATGTRMPSLKIGGVTPFSATDYPGKLAVVVFVQGCPWRCGYCHNPHLQTRAGTDPVAWNDVLSRLRRRIGLLDAVVFGGGEPTIDPALADAMREVRALGFGVGLHSAGMYPRRLVEVLPLLDWVGLDVKAPWLNYAAITGMADGARQARASAEAVLASGVAHEFRTTVHPSLHTEADILTLALSLQAMGVRHYVLQVARTTGCSNDRLNAISTASYPSAGLLAQVENLFKTFCFRQA